MEIDDLKKISNALTVLLSEKQKQDKVSNFFILILGKCHLWEFVFIQQVVLYIYSISVWGLLMMIWRIIEAVSSASKYGILGGGVSTAHSGYRGVVANERQSRADDYALCLK